MADSLPPGYLMRAPTMEDVETTANVVITCELADIGEPDFSVEELREEWQELNLPHDARVVRAPDGKIVAYICLYDKKQHVVFDADGYVHPDHRALGIGTHLLRWAEASARERGRQAPPEARLLLNHGIHPTNLAACRIFEQEGFRRVRQFYRMAIDLQRPPSKPVWPDGITVREFIPGQDERATYEAFEEAFEEHWGRLRGSFDAFVERVRGASFDPGLWLLALEGEEIVGVVLGESHPDKGFIRSVGVRRPWRGRGIGLALLYAAFDAYYQRGTRHVELGVDAESTTGAPRLYARAGMHVAFTIAVYQKELRPGVDLTVRVDG